MVFNSLYASSLGPLKSIHNQMRRAGWACVEKSRGFLDGSTLVGCALACKAALDHGL